MGEKPYVLLAEMDDETRELTRSLLIGLGCEVRLAADGWELLDLFRSSRPRLILAGTVLPGLDGISACRRIREAEKGLLRPRTPVYFLPARDCGCTEDAALTHEGDGFIPKPVRRADLSRALKAALL